MNRGELTQETLKELVHYDPDTGVFTWKPRHRRWFNNDRHWRSWNARFAGKQAFFANGRGYCQGSLLGMSVSAQRLAFLYMTGRWPQPETEHVNGIGTDNR